MPVKKEREEEAPVAKDSAEGGSSPAADRASGEENERPAFPSSIPSSLMMMFKREVSPSSTPDTQATSLTPGVIVQPATKVSPIAASKEQIRDERMREVAIDEPTHD